MGNLCCRYASEFHDDHRSRIGTWRAVRDSDATQCTGACAHAEHRGVVSREPRAPGYELRRVADGAALRDSVSPSTAATATHSTAGSAIVLGARKCVI